MPVVLVGDEVFRPAFAVFDLVTLFFRRRGERGGGNVVFRAAFFPQRLFLCYRLFIAQRCFGRPGGDVACIILHSLQLPDDGVMIFPHQRQLFLLRKLLSKSRFDGFQFSFFLPGVLALRGDGFVQPFGQEVVNALKQAGQTEILFKIIEQISRPELPFFRSQKGKLKAVFAAGAS